MTAEFSKPRLFKVCCKFVIKKLKTWIFLLFYNILSDCHYSDVINSLLNLKKKWICTTRKKYQRKILIKMLQEFHCHLLFMNWNSWRCLVFFSCKWNHMTVELLKISYWKADHNLYVGNYYIYPAHLGKFFWTSRNVLYFS